jgi:RNA polymerase sigma factor (sigma-70 family)
MTTNTAERLDLGSFEEQFQGEFGTIQTHGTVREYTIPDELVLRAQYGEPDAQAETYLRTRPVAYGVARKLESNHTRVEDIAHAGLCKIFEEGLLKRKYKPENNFSGWAHRVVSNLAMDMYRREKRQPSHPIDPGDMWSLAASMDSQDTPELGFSSPEVWEIMNVAGVSKVLALPYILHHVDGYRNDEIATMLGVKVSTIGTRIHRAHLKAGAYYKPQETVAT